MKDWKGDLNVYAEVVTDLKTNEKIGYLRFETDPNGTEMPLGYLDMDEVDDLLKAFNGVVNSTKEKQVAKFQQITYITKGGIDFVFNSKANRKSGKICISKEWNYVNKYGTKVSTI